MSTRFQKSNKGGYREGAGRPLRPGGKLVPITGYVTQEQKDRLLALCKEFGKTFGELLDEKFR